MVAAGGLTLDEAYLAIDYRTLVLLSSDGSATKPEALRRREVRESA